MKRRCILHVGCPKTGTTYLQDVLWASTEALRQQGFRLPLDSLRDHFFLTLALRGRLDPQVDPLPAQTVLQRLQRELRAADDADLIISHELLSAVAQPQVDELLAMLADCDVHVVVTARDLARQVPSEWQQAVKTRFQKTYDDFVSSVVAGDAPHFWAVQDIAAVADRWGRSLPPGNVHIVTLPPPGAGPEILLARFCRVVGLDAETLDTGRVRINTSIGYEQSELVRRINVALGERLPNPRSGYNRAVKFWFAETVLTRQPSVQRLVLPPEHGEWARATTARMTARIEQAGYDVVGDLRDLVPREEPLAQSLHAPTDAEVAAAAVEALAAVLDARGTRGQKRDDPRSPARTLGDLRMLAGSTARRLRLRQA